jgi:hypothetical protein
MAKKLSGAQRRKLEKERAATVEAEQAAAGDDPVAVAFKGLGAPDLEDPVVFLEWTRKVQATALWLALNQPFTETLRERLKWAKELSFVIGATHARSLIERRLKKLEEKLGRGAGTNEHRPAVSSSSGSALRAGRKADRRGPLSGPVPGDPPEEDG